MTFTRVWGSGWSLFLASLLGVSLTGIRAGELEDRREALPRFAEVQAPRIFLEEGDELRYRVRTSVTPPRIPFVSSGRRRKSEYLLCLSVLSRSEDEYELFARIEPEPGVEEAEIEEERASGQDGIRFRISTSGARLEDLGEWSDSRLANATTFLRDLSQMKAAGEDFGQSRRLYLASSKLGFRELDTWIQYHPRGPDPLTGDRVLESRMGETEEEAARGRGYRETGTVRLAADGVPTRIEKSGTLWRRYPFLRVRVGVTYEAVLIERGRRLASRGVLPITD